MGGNPSARQRRHLKGRQLATTTTPRWRDPQGNILVRSTEHQDAFVWVVYLVREKDERGKASRDRDGHYYYQCAGPCVAIDPK